MSRFQKAELYRTTSQYALLPFRFTPLDAERFVLTNLGGQYLLLPRDKLRKFVTHELSSTDPSYIELRSRQFLVDESCAVAGELLAAQVRTRYQHLADFTALHIFVVTLRC